MKLHRKFTRAGTLATALVVLGGAVAVADTASVTLLTVRGTRTLQVTNAAGTGPASLSFGPGDVTSPFGVAVADVAFERKGYQVYATLSDLYPLGETGLSCTAAAKVPSAAFTLDPADTTTTTSPGALVQSLVDFAAADISTALETQLNTVLGTLTDPADITELTNLIAALPATMPLAVPDVAGLPRRLVEADLAGMTPLMTVTADDPAAAFAAEDAHHGCGTTGAANPTEVTLQRGATNDAATTSALWDSLEAAAFTAAATDASLSPTEAMDDGILSDLATTAPTNPATSNDGAGELWLATNEALAATLSTDVLSFLGVSGLASLTTDVIGDLAATVDGLVYSLVGQTGVYGSVPTLTFDPAAAGDPRTGLYHGVMTVTLVTP